MLELQPSPIIALNAAVATSFAIGPQAGLAALVPLVEEGSLKNYPPFCAARADMLRRSGDMAAARCDDEAAAKLTENQSEKEFLLARLADLAR